MREPDYRPAARADLDAIYDYIAADSPDRALAFVEGIATRCLALCEHPMLGRARDDLARGVRILAMRARVVVAYRVEGRRVEILRVFYAGQDYEAILRGERDD